MANNSSKLRNQIWVRTYGENYSGWMSNPVFCLYGGIRWQLPCAARQ